MTILHVTDQNTGRIVAVDIDAPSGNLYIRDYEGNLVQLDLSAPDGIIKVLDADTGNTVTIDYSNPTAVFTVIDPNTGEFVDVDLSNLTGILYSLDENTGEFVSVDLSSAKFVGTKFLGAMPLGPADNIAPTVVITLSQYTFKIGDTATVTFTFSEEVLNFTSADITSPNGSLSSFGVTGNPLVYTATFTPSASVQDSTNVITVGTSWTDLNGNAPASSTNSSNYTVDTTVPTVTITCSQSSPTETSPLNFTFTLSESSADFTINSITVGGVGGVKSNFDGSGSVYTCDIAPSSSGNMTVDISANTFHDAGGNGNTAATQFVINYAIPLVFTDAFARADGAVGNNWNGSTWGIVSQQIKNTPSLGAELVTDGGLENWTNATTPASWTVSKSAANSVNQESTTIHGGSNAARFDIVGTGTYCYISQTLASVAAKSWVQTEYYVESPGGHLSNVVFHGLGIIFAHYMSPSTSSFSHFINTIRTDATEKKLDVSMSEQHDSSIYFDDISAKQLTTSELHLTRPAYPTADYILSLKIKSLETGTFLGIIFALDSISSPLNYLLMTTDGLWGNWKLFKCLNGVLSSVATGGTTTSANDVMKVVKSGTSVRAFKNDVALFTTQTVSDAAIKDNLLAGVFSTYSGNIVDEWSETVRAIGGSTNFLDSFFL